MNKTEVLKLTEAIEKSVANLDHYQALCEAMARESQVRYKAFLDAGLLASRRCI